MDLWRKWAKESGLKGVHFVAMGHSTSTVKRMPDGSTKRVLPNLESSAELYNDFLSFGFDAVCSFGRPRAEMIYTGKYNVSHRSSCAS